MTQHEIEVAVFAAVNAALDARRTVEAVKHAKDHEWIDQKIKESQQREELYRKLREAASTFLMISLLVAVGTRLLTGSWPSQWFH